MKNLEDRPNQAALDQQAGKYAMQAVDDYFSRDLMSQFVDGAKGKLFDVANIKKEVILGLLKEHGVECTWEEYEASLKDESSDVYRIMSEYEGVDFEEIISRKLEELS